MQSLEAKPWSKRHFIWKSD